jgi:hypothetical protein
VIFPVISLTDFAAVKNKTARKQFFQELKQNLREEPETAAMFVKYDLENFAKILEFADISKELDVKVLRVLLRALATSVNKSEDAIEIFFSLARHNILVILFQIYIALKNTIFTNYKNLQNRLLFEILTLVNASLALKRVQKLLRNTKGFETISQPNFWEPIYFSSKLTDDVKVFALWFSVRISRQKLFTEKFVEHFVATAKRFISVIGIRAQETIQSISQIILESEQREFFLKIVSDLPEKLIFILSESDAEMLKSQSVYGNIRARVKCANCKVLEKSEKQFQKCSRCGFVFYCSEPCQRNDWQNHKKICKEIRKQN